MVDREGSYGQDGHAHRRKEEDGKDRRLWEYESNVKRRREWSPKDDNEKNKGRADAVRGVERKKPPENKERRRKVAFTVWTWEQSKDLEIVRGSTVD